MGSCRGVWGTSGLWLALQSRCVDVGATWIMSPTTPGQCLPVRGSRSTSGHAKSPFPLLPIPLILTWLVCPPRCFPSIFGSSLLATASSSCVASYFNFLAGRQPLVLYPVLCVTRFFRPTLRLLASAIDKAVLCSRSATFCSAESPDAPRNHAPEGVGSGETRRTAQEGARGCRLSGQVPSGTMT